MNNNIDMTGKEHLLELWSERKNMQQVIHELIQILKPVWLRMTGSIKN